MIKVMIETTANRRDENLDKFISYLENLGAEVDPNTVPMDDRTTIVIANVTRKALALIESDPRVKSVFSDTQASPSKSIPQEFARYEFLKHVGHLTRYWEQLPDKSSKDKLEGLAFSILSALDGGSAGLPSYYVIPRGSKEDKDFAQERGFHYHPPLEESSAEDLDIAGGLHELFHPVLRGELQKPSGLKTFGDYLRSTSRQRFGYESG